ncbi:MAG: IclR family transcriptional regulator [Chloroflexi bacterium]|nr:IclR family transcriptional regulator [Chloroflexota bacterium]
MTGTSRRKVNEGSSTSKTTVQSVERTLDILEALAKVGETGIAQLSNQVGLHASTVHRLLSTLIARGYVRQNPESGRYLLGLKPLDVARAVRDHLDLRMEAIPVLQELMRRSGETANLAVMDDHQIVYLEQVSSPGWMLRMFVQVGARAPLHSTASGKVLLSALPDEELDRMLHSYRLIPYASRTIVDTGILMAELEEVRRQGYATDYGEQEEGVSCIAAPVRDHTGRVLAVISISGPWIRITPERVPLLVPSVQEACARLSAALGYDPAYHAVVNAAVLTRGGGA